MKLTTKITGFLLALAFPCLLFPAESSQSRAKKSVRFDSVLSVVDFQPCHLKERDLYDGNRGADERIFTARNIQEADFSPEIDQANLVEKIKNRFLPAAQEKVDVAKTKYPQVYVPCNKIKIKSQVIQMATALAVAQTDFYLVQPSEKKLFEAQSHPLQGMLNYVPGDVIIAGERLVGSAALLFAASNISIKNPNYLTVEQANNEFNKHIDFNSVVKVATGIDDKMVDSSILKTIKEEVRQAPKAFLADQALPRAEQKIQRTMGVSEEENINQHITKTSRAAKTMESQQSKMLLQGGLRGVGYGLLFTGVAALGQEAVSYLGYDKTIAIAAVTKWDKQGLSITIGK